MQFQDLLSALDQQKDVSGSSRGNDRAEKSKRVIERVLERLGGVPEGVKFADRSKLDSSIWAMVENAQIDGRFETKAVILVRGDKIAAVGMGEFVSHAAPAFGLPARLPRGWRTSYKPFAKAREIALELAKERGIDLPD